MTKVPPKEQERLFQQILAEHRANEISPMGEVELRLHVAMHVVVELQLREGNPRQMKITKERLIKEGLSEHEALHALGSIVASEVQDVLGAERRFDEKQYIRRLEDLSADKWRAASESTAAEQSKLKN